MNTNDRATLRRWIAEAWDRMMVEAQYAKTLQEGRPAWERTFHQSKRWARFAVACERRLKEIDGATNGTSCCVNYVGRK